MDDNWQLADALGLDRAQSLETWTYSVFVRNLMLDASIGIYEYEKVKKQRVRVNADLTVAPSIVPKADSIDDVLNYESIIEGIEAIVAEGHIELVETLADRIASLCLTDQRVQSVKVGVEKLDVYPQAESVGVAIERRRRAPPRKR
jgi:dihydroneopterin aldolase